MEVDAKLVTATAADTMERPEKTPRIEVEFECLLCGSRNVLYTHRPVRYAVYVCQECKDAIQWVKKYKAAMESTSESRG